MVSYFRIIRKIGALVKGQLGFLDVRSGNFQLIEKQLTHFTRIMLTSMYKEGLKEFINAKRHSFLNKENRVI